MTASQAIEPELVVVAAEVRERARPPSTLERVFRRSVVYCRAAAGAVVRTELHEVPNYGKWLPVFSTLVRLGEFAGECDWISMSGAELLELLPSGVGVILDPRDRHVMVLPPVVAGGRS